MTTELSPLAERARIYAALGEPHRLAIVDMLVVGDASPGEIGGRLGLPTNLVAHHVNVLTEAGVVDRVRSEHDRRRCYLRLRPAALSLLAAPGVVAPTRVVFVCTHNSARSQLAAVLWSDVSSVPVASAGTDPAPRVNPRAVRVARHHGLRLTTGTAHLDEVTADGDLVVAVCDHVHETLPADATRLHWSVPDPVPADTDEAFEATFSDLSGRIDRLAHGMATR